MVVNTFWSLVDRSGDCWLWKGPASRGSPLFNHRSRQFSAHRMCYVLCKGKLGKTSLARKCSSELCVNPDHFEVGTRYHKLPVFWSLVDQSGECWEWLGCKNKTGYGVFSNGLAAHRFSWKSVHGTIPNGLFVCHHCDNPGCVRPDHLFLGTSRDNILDAAKKGRLAQLKGEAHPSVKLTNDKVRKIRELYKTGKFTQKQLGFLYEVGRTNIGMIVRGKTWSHI